MQPLILKNTLSCNTLEKPCSTLPKKKNWHSALWFTDLCVKTRQERSRFMTFWSDLNKYVLCWCYFLVFFPGRAVIYVQKRQTCVRVCTELSCFQQALSMWGHCIMLFSLTLTSCMCPCKVWWEEVLSPSGLSQPHKSLRRLYSSFFILPKFLSFFHQSVFSRRPCRVTPSTTAKTWLYSKHVTNVEQIHFLSIFFFFCCLRETHQEPLKLYEKYIFMFHLMFPACHVIACLPEAAGCCGSC